jgi:hypothetical protein
MVRIKNVLYPLMVQTNKTIRQKIINLNQKNNSNNNDLSFNENGKSQILNKDSFGVLKGLSSNSQKLTMKIDKVIKKINSLLDIKLPNPKLYNVLLEKNREKQCFRKSFEIEAKKEIYEDAELEEIINNQKELDKHLQNKMKLQKIINTLKGEVDKFINTNMYNSEQNKKSSKMLQKPLLMSYNIMKRKNKLSESSSNYIEQTTSIMSKKLHMNSQSNIKKSNDDSSLLNTNSKIFDSAILK